MYYSQAEQDYFDRHSDKYEEYATLNLVLKHEYLKIERGKGFDKNIEKALKSCVTSQSKLDFLGNQITLYNRVLKANSCKITGRPYTCFGIVLWLLPRIEELEDMYADIRDNGYQLSLF